MDELIYIVSDGEEIIPYHAEAKAIEHVKAYIGECEGSVWCDQVNLKTLEVTPVCACVDGEYEEFAP